MRAWAARISAPNQIECANGSLTVLFRILEAVGMDRGSDDAISRE